MSSPTVLSMVLAGGEGKRLAPLSRERAKPAVPFGGQYRLIDFVLSNLVNGGYLKIVVLTQYKSHSLDRHLAQTWRMSPLLGNYVTPVPAQMRRGKHWFAGSADAIFQNFNLIRDEEPDYIIVFGADHIYRMDPSQMVAHHIDSGLGCTVAGIRVPIEQAFQFGVIETSGGDRIDAFLEKPSDPTGLPDAPEQVYASMGNYVFTTDALMEAVATDAEDEESAHDLGGSIIPMMVEAGEAGVYDFQRNQVPGSTERDHAYWRDVGTLDSYYEATMDLISVNPVFNLYNSRWPIFSWNEPKPPAKFVFADGDRVGQAHDSMVSAGVVVSGGTVRSSVLAPGVRVHSYAEIEGSVLLNSVDIGRHAVVRNAIIDKNVQIPEDAQIGVDLERDRERFTVSVGGVVVIGKGEKVDP
ncbi:MAG: glucose-1-phosphate adenylyltransferase [Egibacteraceae bacterium]